MSDSERIPQACEDVDARYENILTQFSTRTQALRTFVEKYEPQIASEQKRVLREYGRWLFPLLREPLRRNLERMKKDDPERSKAEEAYKVISPIADELQRRAVEGSEEKALIDYAERAFKEIDNRRQFLFTGALASLIGNTELAMQKVAFQHYEARPSAVPTSKDHPFTYEELANFRDISEARQFLVEREVDEKLRGDLGSWVAFIKKLCAVKAPYLDNQMVYLVEIAQRRNILVHNDGIANHTYCRNVDDRFLKDIKSGDTLHVGLRYVSRAIARFQLSFSLLIADAWSKANGDKRRIANTLNGLAYDYMNSEEWTVAAGLSNFAMSDKGIPEEIATYARFNYWQSLKWQGKYEQIKSDVEGFDVSAKSLRFRIPWMALKNDLDEAFRLLPEALQSGMIKAIEVQGWPIFRELRLDGRFAEMIKPYEVAQSIENADTAERAAEVVEAGSADIVSKPEAVRPTGTRKASATKRRASAPTRKTGKRR